MKNQLLLPLALLAALLLQSCAPGKMLSLEGTYRTGQQIKFRLTEDMEMHTESAQYEGQTIPPNATTEHKVTDYTYTVRSVRPDRSGLMDMRITQLFKVETDNNGVKTFDSADPFLDTTEITNRVLGIMLRTPFQFTLSPTGQITDFHGMNAAWEDIEEELLRESPLAGDMLKNFKTQFGDEAMGQQQNELWSFLPAGKVRIGQTWKHPVNLQAFKIGGSVTYTLREQNEKSARITFVSRYATERGQPGLIDMGVIQIRYNLKGKGVGTILADQPAALPRRIEQEITMSGPMEVKMPSQDWLRVPIHMKMKSVLEQVN